MFIGIWYSSPAVYNIFDLNSCYLFPHPLPVDCNNNWMDQYSSFSTTMVLIRFIGKLSWPGRSDHPIYNFGHFSWLTIARTKIAPWALPYRTTRMRHRDTLYILALYHPFLHMWLSESLLKIRNLKISTHSFSENIIF